MATLVHFTAADGVAGVWRVDDSGPEGHYRKFAGAAAAKARAEEFFAVKGESVGWASWWEGLGRRTPYGPDTFVFLGDDSGTPEQVLARVTDELVGT